MEYDIAIIGGGPAGYTAAERAAESGLKAVLFEEREIGGVCLNEGCIPTKTMLYSAKLLDNARNASKYGIQVEPGDPPFDWAKILARKDKIVKRLTSGVAMRVTAAGATIVQQHTVLTGESDGKIRIKAGGDTYAVQYALLCTGSENAVPPIKGLQEGRYWGSREALLASGVPDAITIIGGGVIGIEFASLFNSLGSKVTVVEMTGEILGTLDREIASMLRKEYMKRGVTFFLDARVTEIRGGKTVIETGGKEQVLEAGQILVSTGRRPVTAGVGLESLGIKTGKRGVEVNEHLQTSHPRVYACGDVNGLSMLAHSAIRQADAAIHHILGIDDSVNYDAIPWVVYSNPEVAGVGKTEDQLKTANRYYRAIRIPMTYAGRFMAENELFNGYYKLIVDEEERVLGCHLMGNPASELIVIAGMAIEKGFTLDEFRKVVFPHPTVGEVIHESLYL